MGLELDPSTFVVRVGDCLVGRADDLERVSVNDPATSQADAGAAIPWTKSSLDYEALVIAAGKALISLGVSATTLPLAVHCFENVLRSNGGICEQEVRPIEVVFHQLKTTFVYLSMATGCTGVARLVDTNQHRRGTGCWMT